MAGAIGRWWGKQVRRPHYGPDAVRLALTAQDGTPLHAVRLPGPAGAVASVVVVHGITNSGRSPRIFAFAHEVCRWAHVVVVDLRGHGESAGECTYSELEPMDVAAAVRAGHGAAPDVPVVVVGSSLGGLSAVLAAAHPELSRPATIAGVVSVSAPTRQGVDRPGTARLHWLCTSRTGRVVLRRLLRTRARRGWWDVEDISCELPGGTAGFTIVVQDPADRYFGPDHAGLLFALAPDPKALWWMVDSGHGTDLLTPAFAARLEADLRTRFTAPAAPT